MAAYRILVVDDSAFMRKIVSDLIAENPAFEVIATARNGREGLEKVKQLSPDAVTMDVEMPEMNGLEALREIMRHAPTPVIMLSSLTVEGATETIRALEMGAFDFVGKPSGSISLDLYKVKKELHDKLEAAVKSNKRKQIRPAPRLQATLEPPAPIPDKEKNTSLHTAKFHHIVAVGTSTGGPKALQQLLTRLPADFAAPVLIVQHMPPNFTKSLAQRLDMYCAIRVVEAQDGMPVASGTAYIAPGGYHMTVSRTNGLSIRISKEEPRSSHRPSVDTLFESLLPFRDYRRHIVLMTGMGSDGAHGMAALRKSGAETTIAESEDTCIVYGMPRAAVELQCVSDVLPLDQIAPKLVRLVTQAP